MVGPLAMRHRTIMDRADPQGTGRRGGAFAVTMA